MTLSASAIACCDPRTAAAGANVLRAGGNAADAVVAAAFAACVLEYSLCSIGGAGIATLRLPPADGDPSRVLAYDFFCTMPGLGLDARRRDPARFDFRPVDVDFGETTSTFHCGRASVAVPGLVAGLAMIHARHGRLPWADLLAPAIGYAESTFTVSPTMGPVVKMIEPVLRFSSEAEEIYAPGGVFADDTGSIHQPQLAATLRRIAAEGADIIYRGEIADKLVAVHEREGGLVTHADLQAYAPLELPARRISFRARTIHVPPAPSYGGRLVTYALELLDAVDLGPSPFRSPMHVVAIAETMRLLDRARLECSRDLDQLAQPARLARDRAELLSAIELRRAGAPTPSPAGGMPCTTHLSVVDRDGMAVALTLSSGVGSGTIIPGTGVMMNNMLGESDLHPYGFHLHPPGARLHTMMTPTIVERDGELEMVLGSAGANRIRTAIIQTISNVIDNGMDIDAAVNAPRIHFENDLLQMEEARPPDLVDAVRALGYEVRPWPGQNMYFGGVNAILVRHGAPTPAGDRRREGGAVVVA